MSRPLTYPFSALVGQQEMKQALLAAAVNPALGGVLIRGDKGTGKSTAVRALAALLPDIEAASGCPCNCPPNESALMCPTCRESFERSGPLAATRRPMPVVDLPLGATEDRVVGTLNLERALREGERHFEPGLLAAANRGVLYVDEVNLLDDHLVDVLLDAAASSLNIVEREGVSVAHPAAFLLVGTMNPEEGELRPQLLDRFGLCVEVRGLAEPRQRAEIIRRRLEFEADPAGFRLAWEKEEGRLKEALLAARELLPSVRCPAALIELATAVCLRLGVAGHRADLCLIKCARTLAALRGAAEAERCDLAQAASLVLPHRLPRSCAEEEDAAPQVSLREAMEELAAGGAQPGQQGGEGGAQSSGQSAAKPGGEVHSIGAVLPLRAVFSPRCQDVTRPRGGRRGTVEAATGGGRYVRAALPGRRSGFEVALDATLRRAATRQAWREQGNLAVKIEPADLREKIRARRSAHTIVFVLDASGSMAATRHMSETKGAILSLLIDSRLRRERIGLVSFRGSEAELVLAPTADLELAQKRLARLRVGGATPLASGLRLAHDTLRRHARPRREGMLLVLISDGKANRCAARGRLAELQAAAREGFHEAGRTGGPSVLDIQYGRALREALEAAAELKRSGVKALVVDTAAPGSRRQMRRLAEALGGAYARLEDLCSGRLVQLVGASLSSLTDSKQRR